eukprot:Lithocolla_globosa_v1_NODE_499_length_3887_cov_7.353079.p1 type:complete len:360 gc:universal NODE_499_length_3887_cov_7.353079:1357-278(-)
MHKGMGKLTLTQLRTLYNDPEIGGVSKTKFISNLKAKGHSVDKKIVDNLYDEAALQLTKRAPKNFERRPVVVLRVNETWGADLAFVPKFKKDNDGVTVLLFVIDFLSKYLWVRPLVDAKAINTSKALEEIMKTSRREPESMNVDGGSEFRKETLALMKSKGIKVYQSYSEKKVPIVERSIRTMKGRISKYQDSSGSFRYIDVLQKLVKGYNNTVHSTIKMTPTQASDPKNYEQLIKNFFASMKPRKEQRTLFKEGDIVRLSIQKDKFDKESFGAYTSESFKVRRALNTHPPTYLVEDLKGEQLLGSFYNQELLKVGKQADDLDSVKVLKTRTVKKQKQSYVEYSDGTKAWIKSEDLTSK